MGGKRILAFVLVAAMILGDASPALAAEVPENTVQDNVILEEETEGENLESGESGPEKTDTGEEEKKEPENVPALPENVPEQGEGGLLPPTEETPEIPDEKPEGQETPDSPELEGEDAALPEGAQTDDTQIEFAEIDASEYILQAGGSGLLPDSGEEGIALFSDHVENVIADALKNRETEIDVSDYGLTKEMLKSAYVHVLNNNPRLFHVKSEWSVWTNSSGLVIKVEPSYLSIYDETSTIEYEAAVAEALKSVNDQMDDVEKALALHDYLALNCAYENDGQEPYENYNAYNALVDREAVCQGYTLAYTDLLQRAGVSCSYATSDPMNHIWNLVELGDNWYHVDVTWDDPTADFAGRVMHTNFLRSDSGITGTGHHDWVTGIDGLTCDDDSYASEQFWNGLSTAVFFEGDTCYYLSSEGKIIERSHEGSERDVYQLGNCIWPAWGSSSSYWPGIYSGLSRADGYLYCNDKDSLYRISLPDFKASKVYTYGGRDGYLYGSFVRGKELRLAVAQSHNEIPIRLSLQLPQGPENPVYTWNTDTGSTISSQNTGGKKMRAIVFASMENQGEGIQHFFNQPLFRGKNYIDVVILDTSKLDKNGLKTKRDAVEKYQFIDGSNYVLTYCYDETGMQTVFEDYCLRVGETEEYNPENPAYFLIDQNDQIVAHHVYRSSDFYEGFPLSEYLRSVAWEIVSTIETNRYLTSNVAAPNVKIKEHKEGKIVLTWDKVKGAGGYKVYRSETGEEGSWENIGECLVDSYQHETEFVDNSVEVLEGGENRTYYYKVVTRDAYWVYGGSSVVNNIGYETEKDLLKFIALHLVDENGNEVTPLELKAGETKRVYLELERNNGKRVRIDSEEYGLIQWNIGIPYHGEDNSEDTGSYTLDESEQYAALWHERLTNQSNINVTGKGATGVQERKLYCTASGSIWEGLDRHEYNFSISIPIQVSEAEGEVSLPNMTPRDCYTDREALNQYVREQLTARAERIAFCVPEDRWNEWNKDNKGWTPERDGMDFYEDHEGMKSWEGDYLFYSIRSMDYPEQGTMFSVPYRGENYFIYVMDLSYWDDAEQEKKVNDKLDELIWQPAGALYKYHGVAEYEIVKACMTWIRNNVSYIGTTDYRYHSAYSALFNKKATCEGYSLLLYRMLREFGISNRILMGMDANAHTYNIVEIDGKYYYTDSTSGATLKGSRNFSHAEWQPRFNEEEFTNKVTSRISETDYVYVPKNVRLYQGGQKIGDFASFDETKSRMTAGNAYRIALLGDVSLETGDELDFAAGTDCQVELNGHILSVVPVGFGKEIVISVDISGGKAGKGTLKAEKGQTLKLASLENGELTVEGVTVTGEPNISIGGNVTVDEASALTVGSLTVPAASANVVLDGKITANTFTYGAEDTVVENLTVKGQTTVEGGSTLRIKGSAVFDKVEAGKGGFSLELLKLLDENGEELSTGTATFKGALTKSGEDNYAVEIERRKVRQGSAGTSESDPFMPEDTLVNITGAESAIPTGYFCIPKDPYGRDLCLVREGNVLKVKGTVLEVSLKGSGKVKKYISLDAAVAGLAADFGSQKGWYCFTFLSDANLTKNLTLPAFVKWLEFKTAEKEIRNREDEKGRVFARLDLKGFILSTAAEVTLQEGLQISSTGKQGKLNLTGSDMGGTALQIETLPAGTVWVDALGEVFESEPEHCTLLSGVDVSASKEPVVLSTENGQKYSVKANISTTSLYVDSGKWILDNVTLTKEYRVAETAEVEQSAVTLTNADAMIAGHSTLDGTLTMSNTKLEIEASGKLEADITVKSAYGKESKENGYTIENYGCMIGSSLQMAKGTFFNAGTAKIRTVGSINHFENSFSALFMSYSFNQINGSKTVLRENSVLAFGEKAVLYNAELGGARIYQMRGCSTALEGTVTLAENLSEGLAGLEYAMLSRENYEAWWSSERASDDGIVIEGIPAQTRLFTTKIKDFPTEYVNVRQKDEYSAYTDLYQIGQNVRVGRAWIVISAKNIEGNEEMPLKTFTRWSDAMGYLSNLSNPNMTYIVDILEDLDIEQGFTMPAKSAGLVIRGTTVQEGGGKRQNILTYTGDLNLTTPLEFSGIELKAVKNNADYESAVKLNGMSLTFSEGASGIFASVNGNASSVLALNDGSRIEVHGAVNVGELRSEGGGTLTGLAALKRDKAQNITAVTPQITINGQTDITDGQIAIGLKEKAVVNKAVSYNNIDFSADTAENIRAAGIQLAKAVYAKPEDFCLAEDNKGSLDSDTGSSEGMMSKKNGYLLFYGASEYGVKLIYSSDGGRTEIPFLSFADAVAEINGLKTKRDYTIQIGEHAAEASKAAPAALTMPNRNYVSRLRIEGSGIDVQELYYLNNLTLTSDTVLKNVAFKQMVKSGKEYVPVDEQKEDYPAPMNLSTGDFELSIDGNVSFNTPLNLAGGNKGTFSIVWDASLVTDTNEMEADVTGSVIVGSVKGFKTFDVPSLQRIVIREYGTKSAKGVTYKAAELNVAEMTIDGHVLVEGGNVVVKDLVLNNGTIAATGDKTGKVTLTNVVLNGSAPQIRADRDFTISGTLTNHAQWAEFGTRQKPPVKGALQMPYLNITGKVVSDAGQRIVICVLANDCSNDAPVLLSDAPKASGQLLTAKTAGPEFFAAGPGNAAAASDSSGKSELYGPGNPNGYMLAKTGNNIYVYDSEQIAIALCQGDASDGNLSSAKVMDYYPGWQEAVTALNALNQPKETYTLLLLKDAGTKEAPLNFTLPAKAAKVYAASVQGERKNIYYKNALSLGTNTEFADVILNPVTAKGDGASLGMNVGNFELVLKDIQIGKTGGSLKDISGKGAVIFASEDLVVSGGVSGVKSLTVQKDASVKGAVKVNDLILQGEITFTTEGAVTVTDVGNKDGQNTLVYGRTNKNLSNLTINGTIQNENDESEIGGPLCLKMRLPEGKAQADYELALESLKTTGSKTVLSDGKKLAMMPKVSTSDFEFMIDGNVSNKVVKANKGLYLADDKVMQRTIEMEVEVFDEHDGQEPIRTIQCLDYTQAVNEINTRADGTAGYSLYLMGDCTDTNLTDNNPYGPLTMPGSGKAASLMLAGNRAVATAKSKTGEVPKLTFSGNISMNGNLYLEHLTLNPVKGASDAAPADFNISVTGKAGSWASLFLYDVRTVSDEAWDWDAQEMTAEKAGFINQITGTKNVTMVDIWDCDLRLKGGVSNVDTLSLDNARLITSKASTVNDLSVVNGTWDTLGATTITNIIDFLGDGDDSYIAGKQAARSLLPQLTVNNKVADTVICKVIRESDSLTEISYVDSYEDVKLLKAPKEAAGKFEAAWQEGAGDSGNGWIMPEKRVYYKDTAGYVLCGNADDMAVRITGSGDNDDAAPAETYTKCYQDAVTIINNLNDAKASYTLELLKAELMTGKGGAFGKLELPGNNKAAAVEVKSGILDISPTLTFKGDITAYGNVTLNGITLRSVKDEKALAGADFSISVNGTKGASSLTLKDIQVLTSEDGRGCLKDIKGNNKADVILDSTGLLLTGGITGVPFLTVKKGDTARAGARVMGAIKTDTLVLEGNVTFKTEGAVTVTDIENKGGQNTLIYGRTNKNLSNLTINGNVQNEGSEHLCLVMSLPDTSLNKTDYELVLEGLKTAGSKTVLSDVKKLAVMPKVSTFDFEFLIGETDVSDNVVKANKGLYLVNDEIINQAIVMTVSKKQERTMCLDWTQAVNEINTLADGTAEYTLFLPEDDTMDTNLTDNNPYGPLTMPGNGKVAALTVLGEGVDNSILTFTGNISTSGKLALKDLQLNPVKGAANSEAADFNISVTGNAKSGASLTLLDVCTVSDGAWNWAEQKIEKETTGFINQISGTKNVTDVTIKNSNLRLKTGMSNVNTLSLESARLITCKASAVNNLSVAGGTWDALGATTVTNITAFSGDNSYIAGKQAARSLVPQLTLSGRVMCGNPVTCKVIKESNLLTEIVYVDSYEDVKLLKASKESADRFRAAGQDGAISYKDTAGYVVCGDEDDMEMMIISYDSTRKARITYAKCYQDAVTIINNVNEPKAAYELEFLHTGEMYTGKDGTTYAALTLPTKASGITIRGTWDNSGDTTRSTWDDMGGTVLCYTGTLKPSCPVAFESIVLTEGTVKGKDFIPTGQITLASGNVDVAFRDTYTLRNEDAGEEEQAADMVFASVSAAKGKLTLEDETVYVKGNFAVQNLCVSGEAVLITDKAVTLTNVMNEENTGWDASLVLDTKVTAITRAGQQSLTQLVINGTVQGVEIGIAPQMYDLSEKKYHRLTPYEARALLATAQKPDAGQKLANVSKNFDGLEAITLLYSYSDGWSEVTNRGTELNYYLYNNGIYIK